MQNIITKKYFITVLSYDKENKNSKIESNFKIITDIEAGHKRFVDTLMDETELFKLLALSSEYVYEIDIERMFKINEIYKINDEELNALRKLCLENEISIDSNLNRLNNKGE